MRTTRVIWYLPMIAGLLLMAVPGCSKKSVQSGGDEQSSKQGAKGSAGAGGAEGGPTGGIGSNFPDTTLSNRDAGASGGLRGLDSVGGGKSPSEERVTSGTMMAKVDPSQSGGQLDAIRSEEDAAARAAASSSERLASS